jgi:hypothetical protein
MQLLVEVPYLKRKYIGILDNKVTSNFVISFNIKGHS